MFAVASKSFFPSMVFGFYFALFWFLIRFLFYGISFPEVFMPPTTFLFWWNVVFTSLWILLIFVVIIGFLGALLRIPVIGLIVQGIRNQVAEVGWVSFLKNRTIIWFLSQTLILLGSYQFVYTKSSNHQSHSLWLFAILIGYFIKQKFHKPMAQFTGNQRIFIYQTGNLHTKSQLDGRPDEKDVTPP
ncbi:hypothetical protein EHQ89_10530 [Leptospira biflexa]|nr:hypothetical protein EHQ80_16195 [Leptospira biflexa]TGM35351.1 hypothetical protein EHQ89_10530 [Leptospira biflexa]